MPKIKGYSRISLPRSFGRIYGTIANFRNTLYEKGVFKSFSLNTLTISIGNMTVGGTGKTPLVAFVAENLAEKGEKVCILTRGYGRKNPQERVLVSDYKKLLTDAGKAGDEPFELARKLLGKAIVVADADRRAAGNWAKEKFGITAFVLDDAFQHRKVRRDLDIVCVDATNPFGNGKVLPSGILREPLPNLKRADVIVLTRANLIDETQILSLRSQILDFNQNCSIFTTANKISNLTEIQEFQIPKHPNLADHRPLPTDRCLAFCALGNPNNFFEQLKNENFNLVSTEALPDHHFYTPKDIENLEKKAAQNKAEILLTTAKDAVKLKDLKFTLPCYVVESRLVFDDESAFQKIIRNPKSKIQNA